MGFLPGASCIAPAWSNNPIEVQGEPYYASGMKLKRIFSLASLVGMLPQTALVAVHADPAAKKEAPAGESSKKGKVSQIKDLLMKHLDKDGDGKFSDKDKEGVFNEFKSKALAKYDADKDGKLSPEEKSKAKQGVQGMLDKGKAKVAEAKNGEKASPAENGEKSAGKPGPGLLKKFDRDGNGTLDAKEQAEAQTAMDKLFAEADSSTTPGTGKSEKAPAGAKTEPKAPSKTATAPPASK